jgi:hypothetical protein
MPHRSQRFGLTLEELDKKTLLSAGQLGHLAASHHHRDRSSGQQFNYYFVLENLTGQTNLTVKWQVNGLGGTTSSGTPTLRSGVPRSFISGSVLGGASQVRVTYGSAFVIANAISEPGTLPPNPPQTTYLTTPPKSRRRCMDSIPGLKFNANQVNLRHENVFVSNTKITNTFHSS